MSVDSPSIHDACRDGDLDRVKQLIEANPSIVDLDDKHHWRPVFHAALHRRLEIVKLLIASGADLSAHAGYVLHYGGEVPNNKPIVELLIKYGALDAHVRPTDDLNRQFLAAVFLGDECRVKSLLERHPMLANAVDGTGEYPIHHAARNGDTQIVRLLIDQAADVNARSKKNHTVLYCAGGHGHTETVKALLNAGAQIDATFGNDEQTLIEWLAQFPDNDALARVASVLTDFG